MAVAASYTGRLVDLYEKDGMVAVLTTSCYGFGWSSWNDLRLAYDKRVVEFWFEHLKDKDFVHRLCSAGHNNIKDEAIELFENWGYHNVVFQGFANLNVRWIRKGEAFVIREHDGKEWVEFRDAVNWMAF